VATASWWESADFPRTAIGKVRRALLPPPERTAAAGVLPPVPADDAIVEAVASVARAPVERDTQTLGELGLDSLSLVDLALTLEERLERTVNEADLSVDLTVAQLRDLVAAAPPLDPDAELDAAGVFARPEPLWPYTWGRIFRGVSLPIDLLYRYGVTHTTVLGGENLTFASGGPRDLIFAGTHHGHADLALVRYGLAHTPARRLARRLIVATSASEMNLAGAWSWYGRLAFGLLPLRQRGERTSSLRDLIRAARAGNAVLLFPQGQHIPPESERAGDAAAAFRPGVARLAQALDAAVVPFGVAGTERLIPPHRETFEGFVLGGVPVSIARGPLAIAFGQPLRVESDETPAAFTQRLQAASFALTRRAEAALAGAAKNGGAPA
jgi:acyl carrier protein/1-acyl-sn-glycerol-3-phosphate acyltransferase